MSTPGSVGVKAGAPEGPPIEPAEFQRVAGMVREQVRAVIVGQEEAIEGTLICVLAGGHALLEGVPGLGKTMLVRAFGRTMDLQHGRIQFTPDLMPADITGTTVMSEDPSGRRTLAFQAGPIFTNLLLADEINRASPKTQSALLEAMQEGTVTLGTTQRELPQPFCVLATQNPIELQGTYPLPEAQLDRFLLKLLFAMPSLNELDEIVLRTAASEGPPIWQVANVETIQRMRQLVREVPMAHHVVDYASRIVLALQPNASAAGVAGRNIRFGPSPRGAQALCLAGRVAALLAGRYSLAFDDIRSIARQALRHRILLTFDAQRQGITPESLIDAVIEAVPENAQRAVR